MLTRNTWRSARLRVFSVLMCGACMVAQNTLAADVAALSGTYKYVPAQSTDIAQAIDVAVEKMNFIKRPIARSRLAKTNVPYQRIHLQVNAADAEITFDDRKPIRMPIDGQPIKWTREDGEVLDVSAKANGSGLVQTYKADDGTRINSFHMDSTGLLHMQVEVASPQLPQPMKYELVYQRI